MLNITAEIENMMNVKKILIVEDDVEVQESYEIVLKDLGMNIELFWANNGKEALEMFENNQDKIDLVLLDMIMPVMSGKEAFYQLQEINPNIRVLLISGFSKGNDAVELIQAGAIDFLQK